MVSKSERNFHSLSAKDLSVVFLSVISRQELNMAILPSISIIDMVTSTIS